MAVVTAATGARCRSPPRWSAGGTGPCSWTTISTDCSTWWTAGSRPGRTGAVRSRFGRGRGRGLRQSRGHGRRRRGARRSTRRRRRRGPAGRSGRSRRSLLRRRAWSAGPDRRPVPGDRGSAPTVVLVDPPRSTRPVGIGGDRSGGRAPAGARWGAGHPGDLQRGSRPAEFAGSGHRPARKRRRRGVTGRAGGSARTGPGGGPDSVGRYLASTVERAPGDSLQEWRGRACDRVRPPGRSGSRRPGRPCSCGSIRWPGVGAGAGAVRVPRRAVDRAPGLVGDGPSPGVVADVVPGSPGLSVVDAAPSSTPVPERRGEPGEPDAPIDAGEPMAEPPVADRRWCRSQ